MLTQNTVENTLMLHKSSCCSGNYCFSPSVTDLPKNIHFCFLHLLLLRDPASSVLPVHTGVCAVVVEGSQRADAALFTLLPTVLRDGEGGATALAGRHAGAILHGGGTVDRCRERRH